MPFKVKLDRWLETETNRVGDLLLLPKFWNRAWTPQSLKEAISEIGLNYSMTEIEKINDELHNRGIVEDVPEE